MRSSGVHSARLSPTISPEGSSLGGSHRGSPSATPAGDAALRQTPAAVASSVCGLLNHQ